jgi:heme-degrading monooxygenase HmoA
MLIKSKVKDFQAWKKVYDEAAGLRASFGAGADQVYQDVSDPNTYFAIIEWDSLENAQKYAGSPELKAAMEKAGVVGPPAVYFLNKA